MPDLRKTRKDLKIAMVVMAGIDLLAAALYFSPLIGSAETRRMDLNQLQAELTQKTRQVAPLKDLPEKVNLAGLEISDFYKKRFPSQNSQILTEIGKLASANGVRIEQGTYKPADEVTVGLQPIQMEYNLGGSYTSLARFINALERDDMFFIINSVTLGGDPQGPVKLSVKLETYLKVGS
ncbi:MAG: type 4a pilus biogenesis protein PilO [Candidatus Sulfotelmatobacter sp.]